MVVYSSVIGKKYYLYIYYVCSIPIFSTNAEYNLCYEIVINVFLYEKY